MPEEKARPLSRKWGKLKRKRETRHKNRPFPAMTIEQALKRALRVPAIRRRLAAADIMAVWDILVGQEMASHVEPVSLEKGVLLIKADSAVWRQEVSFKKKIILQILARHFQDKDIRDIRLK